MPLSVKINLIREKQDFQASVAIIKGGLPELALQLNKLHPKEKDTFDQYKYDRRKASYLLGRLSAKHAVLNLTDTNRPQSIWIDSGVFQFPIIKCPDIHNIQVSISHAGDIGISIAFPEAHPMGIDLEKIERDKTEVVLSQITNQEKVLLKEVAKNDFGGYYSIFSMKESLSKVIKTGMMLDFEFLEVEEIKVNQQVLEATFTHFGQYKAFSFLKNDYVFSFALPKRTTVMYDQVSLILDLINSAKIPKNLLL
jgi:4'-phosphopantetheinyl transferase